MSTQFDVPRGWNAAVAYASKTPAFRRIRSSRFGEVLPGIANLPKLASMLEQVLSKLRMEVGDEEALNASYMLCITGKYPNPLGVPHLASASVEPNNRVLFAISLIRELTRQIYVRSLSREFSNLAIPSKSSCGFPYMLTGTDGLMIRRAYIESYKRNLSYYADLFASRNWQELYNPRYDALPLFPVCLTNWRMQPDHAKSFSSSSGSSCNWKDREVYDCTYRKTVSDYHLPGYGNCRSMRSRPICAVSSTVNMLYQANVLRMRKELMSYPLWHITSVPDSHRRGFDMWPNGVTCTYDFSQMDRTMAADVWAAYEQGMRLGGASDALINLARCIRYAPFIVMEDRLGIAKNKREPMHLVGSMLNPDSSDNDLGNRSGEADTDIFNKICGTAAHIAACVIAGCFSQLNTSDSPEKIISYFLDHQARCVVGSGDTFMFEGNCGDDHATRFLNQEASDKVAEALMSYDPYWKVTVESDSQLLGWRLNSDGTAVPYMGRAISNFLCPERFWTDSMRRTFYMVGIRARDEHYMLNEQWRLIYRPIMNEYLIRYYGHTIDDYANIPSPAAKVAPTNVAELEMLYNPDAILYKYTTEQISKEFLDSLDLFYNVSAEEVEQIQM